MVEVQEVVPPALRVMLVIPVSFPSRPLLGLCPNPSPVTWVNSDIRGHVQVAVS